MDRPWVAHYDPGVPAHIEYPDVSLPELLASTARRFPRRTATVFHGKKLSYGEIDARAGAFAAGLRRLGIGPGDRVALLLPNVPQYVIAFFGILRAGAVVVPTNPLYTQHELEHQLDDAGAIAIVTLDQLFDRVQAALPYTQISTVIVTGIGEALPMYLRPLLAAKQRREGVHAVRRAGIVHRFDELLTASPSEPVPLSPDQLAVLQYTGGTTGIAKGAMLSHRNLIANTMQAFYWQGASSDEATSILCATPFFHVYGMTIGMNLAVAAGAAMLLVPRWNAKEAAGIVRKYRPAMFPGVPTMYLALSALPGFSAKSFGSLRVCISGAAPLSPDIQRRFQDVSGARLVEGYGLTEASPVTHCNPIHADAREGTVGVPFPDTDAMITDPDTWEPCPPDAIGEVTVRGPQIMLGYWKRPEETADVLRDGWLHTGDLGTVDKDGYFRIVDRKKDVIIAGGYNIYPREVEDVLASHPKIEEAAVIGVPNEYRGETVKAVIVLRVGAQATAEEIVNFCRTMLAPYKVPKIVEFQLQLPKSLIGKVLRRELLANRNSDLQT